MLAWLAWFPPALQACTLRQERDVKASTRVTWPCCLGGVCVSGPSLSPRGWVVGGTALLCSVLVLHGVNQTTHLSCASCTRRYAGAFEAAGWDGATLLAAGEPELEALGIRSHIHRCVGVVLWLSIVRACVRACVLVCDVVCGFGRRLTALRHDTRSLVDPPTHRLVNVPTHSWLAWGDGAGREHAVDHGRNWKAATKHAAVDVSSC